MYLENGRDIFRSILILVRIPVMSHSHSGVCRTPIPEHVAQSGEGKRWLNLLYLRCAAWCGILIVFFGNHPLPRSGISRVVV